MANSYTMMDVTVTDIQQLTPLIKQFTFQKSDGSAFPAFTGGSHIIVQMSDKLSNAYSLMGSPADLSTYKICVRKDVEGKGGSIHMHEALNVGDHIQITEPKNLFGLAEHGERHILIAGGIGITPFIPQLEELMARGADYELHYAFRAPEHGALWGDLQAGCHQANCHSYVNSDGHNLDVTALVQAQPLGTHVYVCGPKALIDATIAACNAARFRDEHIHWEQFASTMPTDGDSFEVVLAQTGQTITVAPDESILQAVEKIGVSVDCLCREGACGTCETAILAGEAEHYDQYLDDDEKASQKTIMICVSRARGKSITLDL